MKKLIVISLITSSLAGLTAFGQGYFVFQTGKSQVWDCFSSSSPQLSTNVNVAFLWAANGSTPEVSMYLSSPSAPPDVAPSLVWAAILADPNFMLAVNNANGQVAVAQSHANGTLIYSNGTAFPVSGTSPDVTYSLFLVGWDANYATPTLAAVANAAVGWSASFNYTSFAGTAAPHSMPLIPEFGVWGIPEPSTLALAGLGSLTLFLFRRRIQAGGASDSTNNH